MAQQSDVQLKPQGFSKPVPGEGGFLASYLVRQFLAGCIGAVILVFVTFFALAARWSPP